MSKNPIRFTSRTFESILADINADPLLADTPDWWKTHWAGIGDVVSVWENASANQGFLRTAFTRRAVRDLCQLIGYEMTGRSTSSGAVMFDISPTAVLPKTVAAADLAAVAPSSGKRLEARAPLAVSALSEVVASGSWNASTDSVTVAGSYLTGEKVRLATSGTLPAGLSSGVDYFVISTGATSLKLASSRANAFAGTAVNFTDAGSGNHQIVRLSRSAQCYQQQSVAAHSIGKSDGFSAWQTFQVGQVGVLWDTVVVTINGVQWSPVDTFVFSAPTDQVYRVTYNTDGTCAIDFADGVYGAVPGEYDVYVAYSYGGGSASNVSAGNQVTAYAGSDQDVVGCFNPSTITGGADEETIDHAQTYAPLALKARDRFVTPDDGIALIQSYGGVMQCQINKNVYGVLSCQVVGIAAGGGQVGSSLRASIQQYLIDRSAMGETDVHFDAATITSKAVSSSLKLSAGYAWASVSAYASLAWKLFLSEAGFEIFSTYKSSGIAAAVALINTIFSTAFAVADYPSVEKIVQQWYAISPRQFGDYIAQSDVDTFIQGGVNGIDYFTIAAPAFPISCGASEITTPGTVTLAQL